jgi:uncharacterized membrane protein (DUF106 family)
MVTMLFGMEWLTPLVFTVLVAVFTSSISQLSFAFFTNKEFIKNGRGEMKKMQKRLLSMKPEEAGYAELQNKLLDLNMQMMSHTLKPTLITMIPFLAIFAYAKSVIPLDQPLITLPFTLPLVGNSFEFIGVYFITSIIFSTIIRKVLRR